MSYTPVTVEEVRKRIQMYKNSFFGWSTYHVEGAFLTGKRKKTLDDELTQIMRIIFRFESKYQHVARKMGCWQILRSIASWLLINYYHRMDHVPWSNTERNRFINENSPVSEEGLIFIKRYYARIAKEVTKWFDDSALFSFGFLVRRFWKRVAEVGRKEDQIWVTNFFNLGINVVKPAGTRSAAKNVLP